jgi:integrase
MSSHVRDSYENYIIQKNRIRPNEEKLLISLSKKTGWTQMGMRNLFASLSKKLGFRVTAYAFRRYVATTLDEKDVELRRISDYLGHTRASTTLSYIESSCARTRQAGEIMGGEME